ncbi:hypothetical protein CEUSTIGMA_g9237.t1 [Chlamydomonas eustigma]|uniref:Potassium transporter n=1 Tax=Chlamydomonas eustigma TaxID=1157962 RepID=A0A250XFX5_9CHLO|nr:hypothetical protein CEUSTIGMA_g9237.t1 [Chlamydomonas eustigma]|eukprot:GAX81809.1 hypothetical protein CEUSTIGMA_g9237.t1 [Chlamydomonas eustigma]
MSDGAKLPIIRKSASAIQRARFYNDEDIKHKIDEIEENKHSWRSTLFLAYGTLGVIYGDVGTSPLYVYSSTFTDFIPEQDDILGAISIIFWSLTLVALIKYVFIVLQANDQGEGGTFALYTRLCRSLGISASGSVTKKEEHEEAIQTAAAVGTLSRATRKNSLNRNTIGSTLHSAMIRKGSGLQDNEEDGEDERLSTGNKTSARVPPIKYSSTSSLSARQSPSASSFIKRLNHLAHSLPFPREAVMHFFQASSRVRLTFMSISIIATCMVIGDGVLTPAISVVSAVSGLQQQVTISQGGIVGISSGILISLFIAQSMGTEGVAMFFSPVVAVWFVCISSIGIYNMSLYGANVWSGLNPYWIYVYFNNHGYKAWKSLGGTMLCMTGTEAMFADLGHFSIPSIGISFSFLVYPSVMLSYLGQGAYLQVYPENVSTAFWSAVPNQFQWPMLVIATLAAVVASQAMITGSFSILRQAMTLGVFPKLKVVHTGEHVEGQVYIGVVNYTLMLLCVAVVAGFNADSTSLGNAYGIAVSTVMLITTNMITLCMIVDWKLNACLITFFWCLYSLIEGAYLSANLLKVPEGGWFTLAITAGVALISFGWLSGQTAKKEALQSAQQQVSLNDIMSVPDGSDVADLGTLTLLPSSSEHHLGATSIGTQGGHVSFSTGVNISSPSVPLSVFASKAAQNLATFSTRAASGGVAAAAAISRQHQALSTFSTGHALAIKSSRKLGSDLLPTLSSSSTSSAIRRVHQEQAVLPGSSSAGVTGHKSRFGPSLGTGSLGSRVGSSFKAKGESDLTVPGHPPLKTVSEGDDEVTRQSIMRREESLLRERKKATGTDASGEAGINNNKPSHPGPLGESRESGGTAAPIRYSTRAGPVAEARVPGTALPGTGSTRSEDEAPAEDLEAVMSGSAADMGSHMHTSDVAEHQTLLARLRGIGLYYTDSSHGIPPVMWAFLRNVEAVHEFAILIQNRFLPIPYLTDDERLAAVPVRGIPNFFRVVARYGYMDKVDHGPEFVQSVIDYISGQLECVVDPSKIIRTQKSEALVSVALAGVPEDVPMIPIINETSTQHVLKTLSNAAMQPSLSSSASMQGRRASVHMVLDSQDPLKRAAAAASLEVLRCAAEEGAVYYLGRTNVQMKEMPKGISKMLHDVWYGDFYRFMALNCWTQTEAWNIPNKSLVELGITVDI